MHYFGFHGYPKEEAQDTGTVNGSSSEAFVSELGGTPISGGGRDGENGKDTVELAPHDHAQLGSIFSVNSTPLPSMAPCPDAPFLNYVNRTRGGGLPTKYSLNVAVVATIEAFDTSRFSIVGSIAGSTDACLSSDPETLGPCYEKSI
jgi:hypothetical protein